MKAFRKKISKSKVYREYVDILNGKLQLSYREAEVFAVLLQLNAEWGSMVKEMGNVLSTDVRRVLMRETLISKTNLARYITALKEKGILIETDKGKVMLNEIFIPEFVDNTCEVRFVLDMI
jgi:hypothetical protein